MKGQGIVTTWTKGRSIASRATSNQGVFGLTLWALMAAVLVLGLPRPAQAKSFCWGNPPFCWDNWTNNGAGPDSYTCEVPATNYDLFTSVQYGTDLERRDVTWQNAVGDVYYYKTQNAWDFRHLIFSRRKRWR